MSSKIRIKMGAIEVDYEGPEEFLRQELRELLSAVAALYRESGIESGVEAERPQDEGTAKAKKPKGKIQATTGTIAAKLGVKSQADLALAACAHLSLVQGLEEMPRKSILDQIKTATGYYDQNHGKNLTLSLRALVKDDKLTEIRDGVYALTAATKQTLEKQLANT